MKFYTAIIKWHTERAEGLTHGYGNGYVLVPKESLLSGVHYNTKIMNEASALKKLGNVTILVEGAEYGLDYLFENVESHCGLTWSSPFNELQRKDVEWIGDVPSDDMLDMWCFGFDTGHCYDTMENCPKEYVIRKTLELKESLESLEASLRE